MLKMRLTEIIDQGSVTGHVGHLQFDDAAKPFYGVSLELEQHHGFEDVAVVVRGKVKVRRELPELPLDAGFVPPSYWRQLCAYLMPGSARPAIALVGPSGNGKTTVAEKALEVLGYQEYLVIDGNETIEPADLIGYMDYVVQDGHGRSVWRDGMVTRAFRQGRAVLINEFDTLNPRAAMCLQSVLQAPGRSNKGRYVTLPGNPDEDRVYPAGECPIVLTMNTYGHAADAQYNSRNTMDSATLDRVSFISTRYENERLILQGAGFSDDLCEQIVDWAMAMREQMARLPDLRLTLSMRTMLRIASAVDDIGLDFSEALEWEWWGRMSEHERQLIEGRVW